MKTKETETAWVVDQRKRSASHGRGTEKKLEHQNDQNRTEAEKEIWERQDSTPGGERKK